MISESPNSWHTSQHGTQHRILQLDGLRAIAILCVIVHHLRKDRLLWIGVDIFFVLSGFLITGILLSRKLAPKDYFSYFYRRRIVRILPPYIVTVLAYGLIFGWDKLVPWPAYAFFGMNLIPVFWSSHLTALPLWSLAVEEQFYLVWPFLVLHLSQRWLLRVAVTAVLLTPVLRSLVTPLFPDHSAVYYLTPFRADLLCAGAVFAILWKDRSILPGLEPLCRTRAWVGCVTGFGTLALLQHWPVFRLSSNTPAANGLDYSLSLLGSVSLLAWALTDRGWLNRLLTWPPMRYVGRISYTMYLVHLMILVLLEQRLHSRVSTVLLEFAITLVWATLSWYLVEQPAMNLAARRRDRVRAGQTALSTPT